MDKRSLVLCLAAPMLFGNTDCCGFDEEDYEECVAEDAAGVVCGNDGRSYASVCDAEWYDAVVVSTGPCDPDDDAIEADLDDRDWDDDIDEDWDEDIDEDLDEDLGDDDADADLDERIDERIASHFDEDEEDDDDDVDERIDEAIEEALDDHMCEPLD